MFGSCGASTEECLFSVFADNYQFKSFDQILDQFGDKKLWLTEMNLSKNWIDSLHAFGSNNSLYHTFTNASYFYRLLHWCNNTKKEIGTVTVHNLIGEYKGS